MRLYRRYAPGIGEGRAIARWPAGVQNAGELRRARQLASELKVTSRR